MIRIGIVGCGRILAAHLRGYRMMRQAGVDDFRITALCSLDEDEARMYVRRGEGPPQRPAVSTIPGDPLAVGDEYLSDFQDDVEVEVYTDYRKMIAEAKIDAVNDFTTHALHHRVGAEALENGKHLMTQKPVAISIAAGRGLCELAESRGLTFGVFENHRYRPLARHLRWLLDSGRLGQPQMMMFTNVGTWWAPDQIVAGTPWRHRREEAGGISLDMGVHLFDAVRQVVGQVETIQGQASTVEPTRCTRDADGQVTDQVDCDADDTFFATFTSESGVPGALAASWAGHAEATVLGRGMTIYGTAGRVTGTQVTFDGQAPVELADLYAEHAGADRKQRDFPHGIEEQFALTQYDWLDAVRRKSPPELSGREGLADLACAFAILESSLAGRRVAVEEVLSGALREYQKPIDAHYGIEV